MAEAPNGTVTETDEATAQLQEMATAAGVELNEPGTEIADAAPERDPQGRFVSNNGTVEDVGVAVDEAPAETSVEDQLAEAQAQLDNLGWAAQLEELAASDPEAAERLLEGIRAQINPSGAVPAEEPDEATPGPTEYDVSEFTDESRWLYEQMMEQARGRDAEIAEMRERLAEGDQRNTEMDAEQLSGLFDATMAGLKEAAGEEFDDGIVEQWILNLHERTGGGWVPDQDMMLEAFTAVYPNLATKIQGQQSAEETAATETKTNAQKAQAGVIGSAPTSRAATAETPLGFNDRIAATANQLGIPWVTPSE